MVLEDTRRDVTLVGAGKAKSTQEKGEADLSRKSENFKLLLMSLK